MRRILARLGPRCLGPGAALVLVASGCAIENAPIALYGPVASAHPSVASVGVLPFRDARPRDQREGKRPLLIPLLVWNQRIGSYVTGDEAFVDEVSDAVARGVADAMDGSRFGRSRLLAVDSGDRQAASLCDRAAVRYLVSGRVRELFATLRQRAFFLLVPTPWISTSFWENHVSAPVGVARIDVEVYDCAAAEPVLDVALERQELYPLATLSQAAGRALGDALQELRDTVARRPGPGPASPTGTSTRTLEPL